MKAKPLERARARKLRAAGWPYKKIAAVLSVSPGSVYEWTKDIKLSAEQLVLNRRGPNGPQNPDTVRRRAASWISKRASRSA